MEILVVLAVPPVLVGLVLLLRWHWNSNHNTLPLLGLSVLLAGSVFGYEFFHAAGGPVPITIDRLLLGGLFVAFGICWFRGVEHIRPLNRADVTVFALMGVVTASALTHDWRFMDNMPASRLLFFYFVPLSLYVVVSTSKLEVADLKLISLALAGLGIYLALTAIAETREATQLVFPRYIMTTSQLEFLGRGRGPFLNPVSNGVFMTTCLVAIWMWWPQRSYRLKVLATVFSLIMLAGIFCTLTRSIWVGCLATIAIAVWYPATRPFKGLMVIAAVTVFLITFPALGHKVFSFKRDKVVSQAEMETSAQLRPMFAIVAWEMFQDRPIYGCGFGQYAREKYPYLQDPKYGQPLSKTKFFMQHNIVLAYLTEMGVLGVAVLLAMLAAMIKVSWDVWNNKRLCSWARNYGLLMLVALANYLINGMFHDVSIAPMLNVLVFFLFGLVNNIAVNQVHFAAPASKMKSLLPVTVRPTASADRSSPMEPTPAR